MEAGTYLTCNIRVKYDSKVTLKYAESYDASYVKNARFFLYYTVFEGGETPPIIV